jgi:hypothetical protein
MSINIDPVIASRISTAWNQLSADQQHQIAPAMLSANQQAVSVAQTQKAPAAPAVPHQLTLAHSALFNDPDQVLSSLQAGAVLDVGPDGVIWGTGKYEQLDPGWAEAFAAYLETLLSGKNAFVDAPQSITIPDSVEIGLAGDWGTGDWRNPGNPAPSTDVRNKMAFLQPDITIHLGDVYYAGTSDQEQRLLTALWPPGKLASFALNSNHEMYSGAKPYFQAIANPPFAQQQGCSYFALENANWVIVGLDSAYFAPESGLYIDGRLFPDGVSSPQNPFLLLKAANAQAAGKQLIVLTHHNGLDEAGLNSTTLWDQVMGAYPAGGGPAYWYWGARSCGRGLSTQVQRQMQVLRSRRPPVGSSFGAQQSERGLV